MSDKVRDATSKDAHTDHETEIIAIDSLNETPDHYDRPLDDGRAEEFDEELEAESLHQADDAGEAAETDTATEKVDSATPGRNWRRDFWRMQVSVKPLSLILIVLVLISAGVATWLYLQYYRPDHDTDPGVARAAISAASDGTVALLSYSPDSLDKDFATAKSHLSGDFLNYYDQFTQQIVAPAAKQKSLKTTARVMRAAIQELHPNSAVVLVFVDQSTTSKDNPDPSMAASSVLVNLALVDGKWLITKFTPV